ncbi:MAG: outer membrane protein assembly factor BamA [Bauldia sp.]
MAAILAVATAAAMVAALSVVAPSSAEAAVATSISVQGNQRVEAETVKAYITIKPGKAYGPADVDESVKILYGTGLFADVLIVQRTSVLVVSLVENPVINSVIFQGNKKIKSNVLVQIVVLKTRGVLTEARLESDIVRIKEYYGTSGRSLANVDAQVTQLGDNRVDVVFLIDEGDLTGVASISFVGNSVFSSSRLSRIIMTRRTNWLSWLNKKDLYSPEKLQADEEALRRFYLEHGYADFQVLDASADFDAVAGKYYLTFTVDEGAKYKFGEINVDSSIPGVDATMLARMVSTKSGRVFDATEVERTVEDLTIELSRLGYVFAAVQPRGDRDYANNIIAITFVIDEGPRAYIERIEIYGNTKTRDYVVRREFEISEGDAYNRVLIDKAERRLRGLGFFETVAISTQQGSSPDKVIVVVNVKEQSTGSFSIAAGVSTTQGLIAEVALEETNFLGRGQALRIAYGGGKTDQTFNIAFSDPYFLGRHMSAGFNIYRNTSSPSSLRKFSTSSTGGGVQVGLPLNNAMKVELNYKINNATSAGAAACDPAPGVGTVTACYFPDGTRLTSSAGYSFIYSTVDNYLDPHNGVFVKFSQDFAGLGGTAAYIRSVADARWYHPIGTKTDIVGQLRVAGGNITGLGMPVAIRDNFFKGGESVRGFASLGYGPRDTAGTAGAAGAGMALGGKNFALATAEVQFPLPAVPPDFGLRGAVFADAGVLFGVDTAACGMGVCDANGTIGDTTIRSSVGGSIMWASPIGQLRLDCAFAITKTTYDNLQACRIAAGASF